jgi:hypothetical protein
MTLHRTPIHHDALRSIRDRRVVWWPASPPSPVPSRSEGFAHCDGRRLEHEVLVALYELKAHNLISVVQDAASLTVDGRARLSEWDATRHLLPGGVVAGDKTRDEDGLMGRDFYVVVKVPVQNLTNEEVDDLQSDTLGFLTENDLYDEGTVESIQEVDGL